MERKLVIEIHWTLKGAMSWLAVIVFLGVAAELCSETVTLNTYYPSPMGIYKMLTTTRDTILARDGGSVGIGTKTPSMKLDVDGSVHIAEQIRIAGGNPGAGKVLTSDASGLGSWQAPSGYGGLPNGVQFYFTSGPVNFTVPDGVTRLWVEVYGGGGAGSGGGNAAAGGGAGGAAMGFLNVLPEQVISGSVGAGGAGGGCLGGNGGTSSFGSLNATGGIRGGCGSSYSGHPGGGGVGSGGIINQQGGAGSPGGYAGDGQGSGGSNTRGGGGGGFKWGGPINGGVCGGGGGAGYVGPPGPGDGGPGCIIIWW